MPLPALPILAALWAAKTGGTYYGYKKLKEKKPELVADWEDKAKRLKGQASEFLFGKEEGAEAPATKTSDKDDGGEPPAP